MMPPIWEGGGRFLGNEELKKRTRIAEFLRDAGRPRRRRHRRASKRRTALSLPRGLLWKHPHLLLPPRCYHPSPRGERRTTTELFVQLFFPRFETFQRHFNERTRSVLVAAQPSATQNRTENRAAPLPLSLSERRSPFPLNVRDPSTPGPSLNADRESALFQSRANGNNSPRAKKIIKC